MGYVESNNFRDPAQQPARPLSIAFPLAAGSPRKEKILKVMR
jgi:hypothetical protein